MTSISAPSVGDLALATSATRQPAMSAHELNPVLRGPVLLALHGRESTNAPIMFGRRLAERLNVALRVMTVVAPPQLYGVPTGLGMTPLSSAFDFTPIQELMVKRSLREACGGEQWTLDIRHGEPTREIRQLAEELNATFIIVAAAPHRRLRHDVAGIRASQVLRNAPCPVLSLSMDACTLPKTVVAGIDFSPSSIRAAQAAMLVLEENGTLILAHAPSPTPSAQPVDGTARARYVADVADAFSRLRNELRPYEPPGITIETGHLQGQVAPALLGLAEVVDADIVTVGSHSRNIVERFFVGSVASTVLHAASCSVLASPPPPPAESTRLTLRMTDTARSEDRSAWAEVLEAVSRRNMGRRLRLEVQDPAVGSQVQAEGYTLHGIDYDHADHRVDIMLGNGVGEAVHLTRTIAGVEAITVHSTPAEGDQSIDIEQGRARTLVLFESWRNPVVSAN